MYLAQSSCGWLMKKVIADELVPNIVGHRTKHAEPLPQKYRRFRERKNRPPFPPRRTRQQTSA